MSPTVLRHMIISSRRLPAAPLEHAGSFTFELPNAAPQPLPKAGAERTLKAVGSSAWFGAV